MAGFPFYPLGTNSVAVTATAQAVSLPSFTGQSAAISEVTDLGLHQYVLTNIGTQTVFIRTDGTTATAANGMPLLANSQVTLSFDASVTSISVIAGATGSTLYATVGRGD